MSQQTIQVLLIALAVVAIAGIAVLFMRKRRSTALRERFGGEYDRLAKRTGDEGKAEALLEAREKRVAAFQIRPISDSQRDAFVGAWRDVQAQFVDDPQGAVTRADQLLGEVMAARGYPVSDFAQRAADLSVEHSHVVEHYRTAHEIAARHERGEAGTEDLRQAMIHYRALFDDLVNEPQSSGDRVDSTEVRHLRHGEKLP